MDGYSSSLGSLTFCFSLIRIGKLAHQQVFFICGRDIRFLEMLVETLEDLERNTADLLKFIESVCTTFQGKPPISC